MKKLIFIFGRSNLVMENAYKNMAKELAIENRCHNFYSFPEAYKHPIDQARITDLLLKQKDLQVAITHSEAMLMRLQTRIAQGRISKEQVLLLHAVGKTPTILKIDDCGRIENWPKNFFGHQLLESVNRTLAAIKRNKSTVSN